MSYQELIDWLIDCFKARLGGQEQKDCVLGWSLSSMSFVCAIHLQRLIAVKTYIYKKAVTIICGKNDIIGQNNVKLCDFIGKTISKLLEGLEPLFLGGHGHKWMVSEVTDNFFSWDVHIISKFGKPAQIEVLFQRQYAKVMLWLVTNHLSKTLTNLSVTSQRSCKYII